MIRYKKSVDFTENIVLSAEAIDRLLEVGTNWKEFNIKEKLQDIAVELAINYVGNSFGFNDKEQINVGDIIFDQNERYEEIKERINNDKYRSRNIVVIGAGASKDAYDCLPLGQDLIDAFENEFISPMSGIPFLHQKYEQFKDETIKLTEYKFDFENFLYILSSHFVPHQLLRDKISQYTGLRYSPSLFYEIIAHLLKHCFVDAVINFNFEEILDQAIEEEIDRQNYQYVLSDGDCVDLDELVVDGRLKTPVYIKPHGTASYKSTLRFTKRHYLDLPFEMKKMLESLISGMRGESDQINRVNLFVIGFDMNSIEFNEILNNFLPPNSRIYHIGWEMDNGKLDRVTSLLPNFFKKTRSFGLKDSTVYGYIPLMYFNSNRSDLRNCITSPLAEVFSYVWRKCHAFFREAYRPRSISRHEIVSYLFQDRSLGGNNDDLVSEVNYLHRKHCVSQIGDKYDNNPEYFRDRVLVEIALELIRSNGIIDVVESLRNDTRIGQYYKLYEQKCRSVGHRRNEIYTIYQLLEEFCSEKQSAHQITKEFLFAKNVYRINPLDFKDETTLAKCEKMLKKRWEKIGYRSGLVDPNWENRSLLFRKIAIITACFKHFSEEQEGEGRYYKVNLTVLYRLLTSKLLSIDFRVRLFGNTDFKIHNGIAWKENVYLKCPGETINVRNSHPFIYELFRLFVKSAGSHYYYIRPRVNDSKNFMWESFSKSKLIHTNLALNYEFREMFLEREWNYLLIILESGEIVRKIILELLYEEQNDSLSAVKKTLLQNLRNKEKQILLVSSFETVFQLTQELIEGPDEINFCERIKIHERFVIPDPRMHELEMDNNRKLVDVMLLPSNWHNHHLAIFLNKNRIGAVHNLSSTSQYHDTHQILKNHFVGSLYMYRRGFSNSITPLYLGFDWLEPHHDNKIMDDMEKVMKLFFTYFCRAFDFHDDPSRMHCSNSITSFFDDHSLNSLSFEFFDSIRFNEVFQSFVKKFIGFAK